MNHGAVTAQRSLHHRPTRTSFTITAILNDSLLLFNHPLQLDIGSQQHQQRRAPLSSHSLRPVLRSTTIFSQPAHETVPEKHEGNDGLWDHRGGVRGITNCCAEKGTFETVLHQFIQEVGPGPRSGCCGALEARLGELDPNIELSGTFPRTSPSPPRLVW
jgi:hypothetical protein